MTDDKALVERLRSVDISWSETGEWCAEAADRIDALNLANQELRSENARLREVVGFYAGWGVVGPLYDDQVNFDSGDIARAALGEPQ